jgi:ABC-type amino acid transport substrate-binding protein
MRRRGRAGTVATLALLLLWGCTSPPAPRPTPRVAPLRAGISLKSPPYGFLRGGDFVGLEVDFARALAQQLERPVQLVEMEWRDLIPALQSGRIDVIMSGMSVTRARAAAIGFTDPYLRSGLVPMVRREDMVMRREPGKGFRCGSNIGVSAGTTGERFVSERCPHDAAIYPTIGDAIDELKQRRIDTVVSDAPIVMWSVSQDEANLAVVLEPLTSEDLAWGVRRDDAALRDALNGALAQWRTDGTRAHILSRWVAYWQELEDREAAFRPPPR